VIIGVPKEIKEQERRIALVPSAAEQLTKRGHTVVVEKNGGIGSGYPDEEYKKAGAEIVDLAEDVFARADMIVKVKEPLPAEFPLLRKGQILFTYLHLAASKALTDALLKSGVTAIAYETIQIGNRLPLLEPMSEIAGRMSVVMGAYFLAKHNGGSGVLLGGVPGVLPGRVVVIGGGTAGVNAARMATGLGADVTILEVDLERMRFLDITMGSAHTLYSSESHLRELMPNVDLLIGAVLLPGAKAPKLITRAMLKAMKTGGHRDRSGRLRRNIATDHAFAACLCRRRRHPLLRRQYAGSVCPHRHSGINQHYLSLRRINCRSRIGRGMQETAGADWRDQHPRRQADLPRRCRGAWLEI